MPNRPKKYPNLWWTLKRKKSMFVCNNGQLVYYNDIVLCLFYLSVQLIFVWRFFLSLHILWYAWVFSTENKSNLPDSIFFIVQTNNFFRLNAKSENIAEIKVYHLTRLDWREFDFCHVDRWMRQLIYPSCDTS